MTEHESRQRDGRGYFAEQGSVVEALRAAVWMIPKGTTDCQGYKCRQSNCFACYGDHALPYDTGLLRAAIPRAEAMERVVEAAKALCADTPGQLEWRNVRSALDSLEDPCG